MSFSKYSLLISVATISTIIDFTGTAFAAPAPVRVGDVFNSLPHAGRPSGIWSREDFRNDKDVMDMLERYDILLAPSSSSLPSIPPTSSTTSLPVVSAHGVDTSSASSSPASSLSESSSESIASKLKLSEATSSALSGSPIFAWPPFFVMPGPDFPASSVVAKEAASSSSGATTSTGVVVPTSTVAITPSSIGAIAHPLISSTTPASTGKAIPSNTVIPTAAPSAASAADADKNEDMPPLLRKARAF